jgi:phage terminase small subunit
MAKKPDISDLSSEAKKIFRALVGEYEIADVAGLRILLVACRAYDRAEGARRTINRDGLMITDKHGVRRPHPLLGNERDSRAAFLAGMKALNFSIEPLRDGPGRPPGK